MAQEATITQLSSFVHDKLNLTSDDVLYIRNFLLCTFFVHEVIWFLFTTPNLLMILFPNPLWDKYKVQKNQKITKEDIIKCVKVVLFNQFCVALPFGTFASVANLKLRGKQPMDIASLPSIPVIIGYVLLYQFIEDLVFYFSHRLFHYGLFYKKIHKMHHEFVAPFSWASEYAHPIEFLVGNLVPLYTGPTIFSKCTKFEFFMEKKTELTFVEGNHVLISTIWLIWRIWITTDVHSGFKFPWNIEHFVGFVYAGVQHHDDHHKVFTSNYSSTLTWLDILIGTYYHPEGRKSSHKKLS